MERLIRVGVEAHCGENGARIDSDSYMSEELL